MNFMYGFHCGKSAKCYELMNSMEISFQTFDNIQRVIHCLLTISTLKSIHL